MYQFSPVYINSTRRKDIDIDYDNGTVPFPRREENDFSLLPLVISSPADNVEISYWPTKITLVTPLHNPAPGTTKLQVRAVNSTEDHNELSDGAARMAWNLPAQAIQRLCDQLKGAVNFSEPTPVKPAIFHGYKNENMDRWLQRFALYLALREYSPQAAIQLAPHLSGPAESFFYNLPDVVQGPDTALLDALKERFARTHRSLRLRQSLSHLSVRRQGVTEPIEKFQQARCPDDTKFLCFARCHKWKRWPR